MHDSTMQFLGTGATSGDAAPSLSGLNVNAPVHSDPLEEWDAIAWSSHPDMLKLREQLNLIAPQDTNVLLEGETGTGKTRLARLIHDLSPRQGAPYLVINCGALSESLIESEMFGHVKGAFTGADKDRVGKFSEVGRGTLLLDEIDALPLGLQAKLLRAVEERMFEPVGSNQSQPMRARLIAASSRPLAQEVSEGRFRADLFYRLYVVAFTLPPLRERRGAIRPLISWFMNSFRDRMSRQIVGVSPEALHMLEEYSWPGNIRELRNVIERAVSLCPGPRIEVRDLSDAVHRVQPLPGPSTLPARPVTLSSTSLRNSSLAQTRQDAECAHIVEVLQRHGDNRLRAAMELGISRMTLYKKLHKYGLMDRQAAQSTLGGSGMTLLDEVRTRRRLNRRAAV